MTDPHSLAPAVLQLVGRIAVLLAGLRVLASTWEAPSPGALPLVITEEDRRRRDGQLNWRQVFLFSGGGLRVFFAARALLG